MSSHLFKCKRCDESKPREGFSKAQFKKGSSKRRCKPCVAKEVEQNRAIEEKRTAIKQNRRKKQTTILQDNDEANHAFISTAPQHSHLTTAELHKPKSSCIIAEFDRFLQTMFAHKDFKLTYAHVSTYLKRRERPILEDYESLQQQIPRSFRSDSSIWRRHVRRNYPLESCKLVAGAVLMLGSELNSETLQYMACRHAQSAGGLDLPKNYELGISEFLDNVNIAEANARQGKSSMINVSVYDIMPFKSFAIAMKLKQYNSGGYAHAFVVTMGPNPETAEIEVRVYQSFGPPDVGYDINEFFSNSWNDPITLKDFKTGFVENMKFCFAKTQRWNIGIGKRYESMFHARPRGMPGDKRFRRINKYVMKTLVRSQIWELKETYFRENMKLMMLEWH